jgi:hypothetical protein
VDWYLYGKMESLAARGATDIVKYVTRADGEEVDLGDVPVHAAHRLRGRVVLREGRQIAAGNRVILASTQASDSQTAMVDADGRFEFRGLPTGGYEIAASIRGYRLPPTPQPKQENYPNREAFGNALNDYYTAVRGVIILSLDRDVDDLTITLEPLRR